MVEIPCTRQIIAKWLLYHEPRIRCIETDRCDSFRDCDEVFRTETEVIRDFIFSSSYFLQFCTKRAEITSLDIDTDIGNGLCMIQQISVRCEEVAEIVTRPVTTTDTDEMIINSFHKKCAESREHIAGREVTSGPEKDKSFHRESI